MKTRYLISLFALSGVAQAQTVSAPSAPETQTPFFRDVPRDHWAFAAVQKLAGAGIIEGVGDHSAPVAKPIIAVAPRVSAQKNPATVIKSKVALSGNSALKGSKIDVDVATQKSIITLRGTVKTPAQKQLAGAIARKNAPGFTVSNQLRVGR